MEKHDIELMAGMTVRQQDALTGDSENSPVADELTPENPERGEKVKRGWQEIRQLLLPSRDYFVTPVLVGLNVLVFIAMVGSGVNFFMPSVESLVLWGGNLKALTLDGQQWRLLTNIFVHGGIFHLLMNLYALLYIGSLLERNFGKLNYLLVYLISGLVASISSLLTYETMVSVGASGAIFGVYGLFLALLLFKVIRIPDEVRRNLIPSTLFFIGFNVLYGFAKDGIDNAAHLGGLLSGFALGLVFMPALQVRENSYRILVGLLFLTVLFTVFLPRFVSSKISEYGQAMQRFAENEERALWMYREDLSEMKPEQIQFYYDRMRNEGIDLWNQNRAMLDSLTDMPELLEGNLKLLKEYCDLRAQSCELMQYLLRYNQLEHENRLVAINQRIESIIKQLQQQNEGR